MKHSYQKRLPALAALLGFLLCPLLCAEPLKTMAWNMEWFPGGRPNAKTAERTAQFEAVRKILVAESPEILLAQELTDERAFNDLVKNVPGMKVHVFSNFPESDGKTPGPLQLAVASTLKADSAWFEEFKPSETLPNLRRGFAFAALEHPDDGLIMLYSVHLKSNHGSDTPEGEREVAATRAESAKQLIAHKAEMEKKYAGRKILGWVIGGDLNTNHDGQFPICTAVADLVRAGFHNSWGETPKEKRLTWRPDPKYSSFKATTFDYLLTSGFAKTRAKTVPGVPLETSDHAPILIDLSVE